MKTTDIVLYALLAMIVSGISVSFWRYQKDPANRFNFLDLLMENGRLSRIALAFDAVLVVTSWIVLKLVVDGKMTEGYLAIYGGFWIAPVLAKMFATNSVVSASTTTTVSTEVVETVPTKSNKIHGKIDAIK